MIVEISGGESGIAEYLKGGRKKDRNFTRKEADKRVTLYGDLKVTDSIIKNLEFKENYSLVSSSFLEFAGWSSLAAFLNSLIPVPIPFINSGIFLPPKSKTTIAIINITCIGPITPKNMVKAFMILVF